LKKKLPLINLEGLETLTNGPIRNFEHLEDLVISFFISPIQDSGSWNLTGLAIFIGSCNMAES
jgi:hypothetical protein